MDNEILKPDNGIKYHLTWSSILLDLHKLREFPKLIGMIHPWVTYKESNKFAKKENARGTIFFAFHSAGGANISGYNDQDSINYLLKLPEEFHPLTVSLHPSDRGSSREDFFRSFGLNVVSMGPSFASDFVDNFYETISNFEYSVSESWGSQVAYCADFGLKTVILPRKIEVVSKLTGEAIVSERDKIYAEKLARAEQLFADFEVDQQIEQIDFIRETLGYQYRRKRFIQVVFCYSLIIRVGLFWVLTKWTPKNFKIILNVLRKNN
jgi:hypothetical protein